MLLAMLWDNDGVLVDTEQLFYQPSRELFARLGLALGAQHFFDWYPALVIEDTPRGLQVATAAGIRCKILRNVQTRHHDFLGAWRVVDTMAQLRAEVAALLVAG